MLTCKVSRYCLLVLNDSAMSHKVTAQLCLSARQFLAPAVTVGETKGAINSASVLVFTSSFAYNFVRKKARITIFGVWVTSRWIMDKLKYFQSEFNTQGRRGENDDVTALGRWAVREHFVSGAYL